MGNSKDRAVELTSVPLTLKPKVALEKNDDGTYTVHIDIHSSGDPKFLTWLGRNRNAGAVITVHSCEMDEITKLRISGLRERDSSNDDLRVRATALEIIYEAAAYHASDIHITLRGEYCEVQIVDRGELRVLRRLSQEEGEGIIRAIYQGLSKVRQASYNPLDIQIAQIAGADLDASRGISSVRIIRGPAYPQAQGGGFMTLRLQYQHSGGGTKSNLPQLEYPRPPDGSLQLSRLGYSDAQVEKLKMLMMSPSGLVIFTGPVGSGKTTTMFEMLQEMARAHPWLRQVTVEDPVEYPMDWAVQLPVTETGNEAETGAAFLEKVRAMLRMAPNIILLGEIRGPEVAVAAINASMSGHLTISTMHTNDPYLFVDRMEIMDKDRLNRRIFCDPLVVRGVIAQRILPRLCKACKKPMASSEVIPARIVDALEKKGDVSKVFVRGDGCGNCSHGATERFAIAEIVMTDAQLMSDFIEHGSAVARDNYRHRSTSDPSLMETALRHVFAGDVDPRSVEQSVDLIVAPE